MFSDDSLSYGVNYHINVLIIAQPNCTDERLRIKI